MALETLRGLSIGSEADKNIVNTARTVMVNMGIDKDYAKNSNDSLRTKVLRELERVSKGSVNTSDELWKELLTYCIAKYAGIDITLRKALWAEKTTRKPEDIRMYNLLVCVEDDDQVIWHEDYNDPNKVLYLGDKVNF